MGVIHLEETTSTNDEARRLGQGGEGGGTVVVAERQTGGRGRLGRAWASPWGGLWMSMLVRPAADRMEEMPLLSIAAGVAVAGAIEEIFAELEVEEMPLLGWPNDVLIGEQKIAGILCEACTAGAGAPFAVIGVGMNLNNTPRDLPPELTGAATSVKELSGKTYPREKALEKVVRLLDNRISCVNSGGRDEVFSEWRKRSALFGRKVLIQSPGTAARAAVPFGLDGRGRLLIREEDGAETAVEFEETTLIR